MECDIFKSVTPDLHFMLPGTTGNVPRYVELIQEKLDLQMYIPIYVGNQCQVFQIFIKWIKMRKVNWHWKRSDQNTIENLCENVKNKLAEKQLLIIKPLGMSTIVVWIK